MGLIGAAARTKQPKNVIFQLLTTVAMTKMSFFAQFLAISEEFIKQKL